MARYEPPEWGLAGRNAFGISLEVIKSGVVVETLALPLGAGDTNKSKSAGGESCVVAGRMEPLCDLVLQHPSISRVHAALQFDEHGALFLCDLRSTHGCFVNKKRAPPNQFVRLHIGDVLVFGESTRLYAVCGPPELLPAEYESLNLVKFREKLEKKRAMRVEQQEMENKKLESGASWGFAEDAEEEEEVEEEAAGDEKEQLPDYLRNLKEDDQPYKSRVSKSELNEKDAKLFQQLQTRIRKMENLKQERSRILAKQHQLDGLSEGQQSTLDRNEQRIEALMKEIDALEDRIHAKNEQRSQTNAAAAGGGVKRKKRSVNEDLYDYASDEDDFYDRTKANQHKLTARKQQLTGSAVSTAASQQKKDSQSAKSEVLTVDSIRKNIKRLESELIEVQTRVEHASLGEEAPAETKQEEEGKDSLDSFMAVTTKQLHVTEADAVQKRKAELETELQRQRQLLAVAMPALAALPLHKITVESKEKEAGRHFSVDEPEASEGSQHVSSAPADDTKSHKQAIAVNQQKAEPKPAAAQSNSIAPSSEVHPPAPKVEETKGARESAAVREPDSKTVEGTGWVPKRAEPQPSPKKKKKKRRVMGPTLGPPAPIKPRSVDSGKIKGDDGDTLEGGDQVWVPPANQTGDGRTKLNEKFGY